MSKSSAEADGTSQELEWAECECLTWATAPEMGPRKKGHHPACPKGHEKECRCFYCELDLKNQSVRETPRMTISWSTKSEFVAFLYELLRDHVPIGVVEAIVEEQEEHRNENMGWLLTNGHLAAYCEEVAERLCLQKEQPPLQIAWAKDSLSKLVEEAMAVMDSRGFHLSFSEARQSTERPDVVVLTNAILRRKAQDADGSQES